MPVVPQKGCAAAVGDGSYRFQVVGEASYQNQLETITGGRTEDGVDYKCVAVLLPEANNPYDPNAVCVFVDGRVVGYLPRNQAAACKHALAEDGYAMCACYARIVGGWDRGEDDRGYFGVKLDVVIPFNLQPAASRSQKASDQAITPTKETSRVGIKRAFIGATLAVAALLVIIWDASTRWTTAPQVSVALRGPRVDALIPRVQPATPIFIPSPAPGPIWLPADAPVPQRRPRPNF